MYATTTSLQTLMIGTTFDSATTSLATKLITHAENEINKYLSKRYNIGSFNDTTTSVPPIVTSICETLVEGYMHQRMSRGGKESMARGKALIEQAISNLSLIADYKLDLVDSRGDRINDISSGGFLIKSTTENYSNTFNEDSQLNWEMDSLKLLDIESERESNG